MDNLQLPVQLDPGIDGEAVCVLLWGGERISMVLWRLMVSEMLL